MRKKEPIEKLKIKSVVKKSICLLLAACLVIAGGLLTTPAFAEDVIEFIPYDESAAFVVYDMYAEVYDSAGQSQEILDFVNSIRKEACDEGLFFSWTGNYLSSGDFVPLTWNGGIERYALTRAVDISFNFAHGVYSICGMPAGGSHDVATENICWGGLGYYTPMDLIRIYYKEKEVYVDAYNRAVAAGIPQNEIPNYINYNANGQIGHYLSLINPQFRSIGSSTLGRGGAIRNVTLLSYNAGDGNFTNLAGPNYLRIPMSADRLGVFHDYIYPQEVEYGSTAAGYFNLVGNAGADRFVRANNITIKADDPQTISISDDLATFTANGKGTAAFHIMAGGQEYSSFTVRVKVQVDSASLSKQPDSLRYTQEGGYSLEGAAMEVKYADGSSEVLPASYAAVVGEQRNGRQYDVYLDYQGSRFTVSFNDETPDYPAVLEVKAPSKLNYAVGDRLDLSGGKAYVTSYFGETTAYDLSDSSVSVSGFDSSYEGRKQVFVSVGNLNSSFTVNVSAPVTLVGIGAEPPYKTYYQAGDPLVLSGGRLVLYYSNGTASYLALDESMISGYNKEMIGTQAVSVNYSGFSSEFYVTVYGRAQYEEIIRTIGQDTEEEPELAEAEVPMNANDPWLVMQAVKLYGLRPDMSEFFGASVSRISRGWPVRCANMIMFSKEFRSVKLPQE